MGPAVRPLVRDNLLASIEVLLPPPKPAPRTTPGGIRWAAEKCLAASSTCLKTGTACEDLPGELGSGSGKTFRTILDEWQGAGVLDRRHRVLLAKLNGADPIDWSRPAIHCATARSVACRQLTNVRPTGVVSVHELPTAGGTHPGPPAGRLCI